MHNTCIINGSYRLRGNQNRSQCGHQHANREQNLGILHLVLRDTVLRKDHGKDHGMVLRMVRGKLLHMVRRKAPDNMVLEEPLEDSMVPAERPEEDNTVPEELQACRLGCMLVGMCTVSVLDTALVSDACSCTNPTSFWVESPDRLHGSHRCKPFG